MMKLRNSEHRVQSNLNNCKTQLQIQVNPFPFFLASSESCNEVIGPLITKLSDIHIIHIREEKGLRECVSLRIGSRSSVRI